MLQQTPHCIFFCSNYNIKICIHSNHTLHFLLFIYNKFIYNNRWRRPGEKLREYLSVARHGPGAAQGLWR